MITSLLCLVSLLSANELKINDSITMKKTLKNDDLSTTLRLSINDMSKNVIDDSLKKIIDSFRDNKAVSVGTYSVYPDYKYFKGVQSFNGYVGNVVFEVHFSSEEILKDVLGQINKNNSFKVSQDPIKKEISEKRRESAREKLKANLLDKISNDAIAHSKSTGLKCFASNVSFSNSEPFSVITKRTNALSGESTESVALPLGESVEVSLSAKVSYICNKNKEVKKQSKKKKAKKQTKKKVIKKQIKKDTIVKEYPVSKVSR